MFEEMISELKNGVMPENSRLRQRFDRALVKKLGVIKTPHSFWSRDKKINPAAKELLWAAILLGDRDSFRLIEAVIATEIAEKRKVSGRLQDPAVSSQSPVESYIDELLLLAPSEDFRLILEHRIDDIRN